MLGLVLSIPVIQWTNGCLTIYGYTGFHWSSSSCRLALCVASGQSWDHSHPTLFSSHYGQLPTPTWSEQLWLNTNQKWWSVQLFAPWQCSLVWLCMLVSARLSCNTFTDLWLLCVWWSSWWLCWVCLSKPRFGTRLHVDLLLLYSVSSSFMIQRWL